MSLGKLLTTGRSLIGLESSTSRYQMRGRHLLPKFGSGRNPFSEDTAEPPASARSETTEPARVSRFQLSPAELAAARLKDTARLPVPCALPREPESVDARRRRRWIPAGAWLWRKVTAWNPMALWRSRQSEARPAVPRFARTPVQGELSLDKVKVVRNDLNEADVEVVTARLKVQPKPEKPGREEKPAETAELIKT